MQYRTNFSPSSCARKEFCWLFGLVLIEGGDDGQKECYYLCNAYALRSAWFVLYSFVGMNVGSIDVYVLYGL